MSERPLRALPATRAHACHYERGPNPRPFAKQARELCTESNEHHAQVWFCTTCRMLEQRLTPLHLTPGFAEVLADADVSITVDNSELYGGER